MEYMKSGDTKAAWGHLWRWCTDAPGMLPHWQSTKGNVVRIFPPLKERHPWQVVVYGVADDAKSCEVVGDDAENRAFCIAEGYTRLTRT